MSLELLKNKETWKKVGNVAYRFGKAVVVDGVKAQALKGAKVVITTGFEEGMEGIKKIGIDDVLGEEKVKEKKPKKSWFSRKKKNDEIEDVLDEVSEESAIDWKDYTEEKSDEVFEGEIIDAK